MTKEIPANLTATLNKAVGNANAASLLYRIVYWNTRKIGGVMHEGRMWSFRPQKEWIEQEAGLPERTGKRAWARLVADDFIMTEMRLGGPLGNRRIMMHVALTDKTYTILNDAGVPNMALPVTNAELKLKDYAKAALKEKAAAAHAAEKMTWEQLTADPAD